jgi:hypothetical protein
MMGCKLFSNSLCQVKYYNFPSEENINMVLTNISLKAGPAGPACYSRMAIYAFIIES